MGKCAVFASELPPEENWPLLYPWLREVYGAKRSRIEKYKDDRKKWASVCADRLAKFAIYDMFGMRDPAFEEDKKGKPVAISADRVYFSVSHSADMVLCAVSDRPVGADVEKIRKVGRALARRIMTDQEFGAFLSRPEDERFFFRIWTLKESYLKYTGEGIAGLGLDRTDFSVTDGGAVESKLEGVRFGLYDLPGYQAAVCTAGEECPGRISEIPFGRLLSF